MAQPKENKYGIDRWTSNGYGIKVISNPKQKKTSKKGTKKKGTK